MIIAIITTYLVVAFIFTTYYFSKLIGAFDSETELATTVIEHPTITVVTTMLLGLFWVLSLPYVLLKK